MSSSCGLEILRGQRYKTSSLHTIRAYSDLFEQPLNLEAPSAETELTVASNSQKNEEVHVGLSWTVGLGKYKLTKVITIAPRFLIKNNMAEAICFREHGVAPRGKSTLDPSERVPIHTMRAGYEKLLTIAFPGLNTEWSVSLRTVSTGHSSPSVGRRRSASRTSVLCTSVSRSQENDRRAT